MCQIEVGLLAAAAEVVDLAGLSGAPRGFDAGAVVEHVNPVANLLPVAVHRHLFVPHDVGDEQRDQLLGELIRPVVVGTARDDRRHVEGVLIRLHEHVRTGLRGRIGAVRMERRFFGEGAGVAEAAVHFVRRDLHVFLHVEFAGGVEQDLRADHVRAKERTRILDAAIDVALRREVDHVRDAHLHGGADLLAVRDVALDELVAKLALDILEVGEVARVGEPVEVDDADRGIGGEQVSNEVRPDEPAPTGDEQFGHPDLAVERKEAGAFRPGEWDRFTRKGLRRQTGGGKSCGERRCRPWIPTNDSAIG